MPNTDAVVRFLEEHAGSGQPVTIVYNGGSRPGQTREVIVHAIKDDGRRVWISEPPSTKRKQYLIEKIAVVDDLDDDLPPLAHDAAVDPHNGYGDLVESFQCLDDLIEYFRPQFESAGFVARKFNDYRWKLLLWPEELKEKRDISVIDVSYRMESEFVEDHVWDMEKDAPVVKAHKRARPPREYFVINGRTSQRVEKAAEHLDSAIRVIRFNAIRWIDMVRRSTRNLSQDGLKKLHGAIVEAKRADEEAIAKGEEPKYGVEVYPDWRAQAEVLEEEMTSRGIDFDPIDW